MDLPTLRRIGPAALYVVPVGNGRFLERVGLTNVVELEWWQSHRVDGLEITCVPARHWSMRAPWNRNDALWSGFVVRGAEGALYHSGDSAYFDGFRRSARASARSTGRACPSAPTSRAGSWSRST